MNENRHRRESSKFLNGFSSAFSHIRRAAGIEFSDSLRLKLALKTATACLMAMAAARLLGLPQEYWAVISAFLIVQLSLADTLRKGLLRITGTLGGCLFGLILALIFPGKVYLCAAALFVWCVGLFYFSQHRRYSYAITLAALTPFMVIMGGAADYHHAAAVAADRFATITLGVLLAWFVTAFLGPIKEKKELAASCGKMIKRSLSFCLTVFRDPSSASLPSEEALLREYLYRIEYFLEKIDFAEEAGFGPERARSLITSLRSLLSYAFHLKKTLLEGRSIPEREEPIETGFTRHLSLFRDKLRKVRDEHVPAYLAAHREEIGRICADLEEEKMSLYHSPKAEGSINPLRVTRIMFLFYLADTLVEIGDNSSRPPQAKEIPEKDPTRPAPKPKRSLAIDAEAARSALKTSTAVLISALAWAFPLKNIQAVISATLIAGQRHQSASYRKAFFRILGTILGGAAGFALVVLLGHWEEAMALPAAAVILLFSYIGLGEEDWHYTGLTAGLCFILVVGSISPGEQIPAAALRRLAGVLLGGLTAALVVKFVFPFDYRKKLAALQKRLLTLCRASLDALGEKIAGGGGDKDEINNLRREMRDTSLEFVSLSRFIAWDRIRNFRRRRYYSKLSQLVLNIYRNFFPLFATTRRLLPAEKEIPLRSRIAAILSALSRELGKETAATQGDASFTLNELRKQVTDSIRELNEIEASTPPGSDREHRTELFFFTRVFLYHTRILIDDLSNMMKASTAYYPGNAHHLKALKGYL